MPGGPSPEPAGAGSAIVRRSDLYREGNDAVILANALVRVVISPQAGARAFIFEDRATKHSIFTTVGAMRDDVTPEPPLSTSDRIAKYTHQFPAGTFNRNYDVETLASGERAVSAARATRRPTSGPGEPMHSRP